MVLVFIDGRIFQSRSTFGPKIREWVAVHISHLITKHTNIEIASRTDLESKRPDGRTDLKRINKTGAKIKVLLLVPLPLDETGFHVRHAIDDELY